MLDKMLKHVGNLNEYISITQDIGKMKDKPKLQINMSAVLCLKKVRALEIEYFNKCDGSGAAVFMFERMLEIPPSKTWGLIVKELVSLLQYWLEAMRKHLIKHNPNWWSFLKILLRFTKLIRVKDQSVPNILVERTAECLLDLATSDKPDVLQRHEILYCLNLFCGESGRDCRMSVRGKLDNYLIKLSSLLSSCGHFPTQFSALETLMRWLLPRHDQAVRLDAAKKWFPNTVCGVKALDIFMSRAWQDFFQDARDFLNACNEKSTLVVSIVCKKVNIDTVVVVSGKDKREIWLDVNMVDKSLSIQLDPRALDCMGIDAASWETIVVTDDCIQNVQLGKESSEIVLCLSTSVSIRTFPSSAAVGVACELKAVVSSNSLSCLDKALRDLFTNRYQLLLDLENIISSPKEEKKTTVGCMDGDSRFSIPAEVPKRKQSGFIVRSRKSTLWKSQSTTSTSSLAQLHEKLTALPRYNFEKEAVHVCALPELSTVTELSETEERPSDTIASTIKIYRPFGVCQKKLINEKSSQSDGEVHKKSTYSRCLSPVVQEDENSTSCLLVATIGSADESVINETLERLTKSKDYQGDNIVDLLVKEALQRDVNEKDKFLGSGINISDYKNIQDATVIDTEAIENTPIEKQSILTKNKENNEKTCTVISNTTTDESNDVVYDTPLNSINLKKRKKIFRNKQVPEKTVKEAPTFDVQVMENFFSQHLNEDQRGDIVISPTLARKINETSSESSHFDELLNEGIHMNPDVAKEFEIPDLDVIECLNSMVDKVCSDLEKCTELFDKANDIQFVDLNKLEPTPFRGTLKESINITNILTNTKTKKDVEPKQMSKRKETQNIKLKYDTKKLANTRATAKKGKKQSKTQGADDISPANDHIVEITNETPQTPEPRKTPSRLENSPLMRRKRKLYSPKNESTIEQLEISNDMETEINNEFKVSKVRTYKATCYKDIEKDRVKCTRMPRSKKNRTRSEPCPSPRTKKMNEIFDHLKDKVESNDAIKFADKTKEKDIAFYNFTSDSEDEDFKKKKLEVQTRISSSTNKEASTTSRRNRKVTKINYSENKSSDGSNKKIELKPKRKPRRKKPTKSKMAKNDSVIDQTMRKAPPEDLNTSMTPYRPVSKGADKLVLPCFKPAEMEIIPEESLIDSTDNYESGTKSKSYNKKDLLSLKKEKAKQNNSVANDGNGTESPLPGLLIETMPKNIANYDGNDSMSVHMLQKLDKLLQEGPEANNDTNGTQNLLTDNEKMNCSPPSINIIEEFDKIENYYTMNTSQNKCNKNKSDNISKNKIFTKNTREQSNLQRKKMSTEENAQIIELIEPTDIKSVKSIVTVGKSPITAHGDSNELPPDTNQLLQKLKPRNLDIEYLDPSLKDYFMKLNDEMNDTAAHRRELSNKEKCAKTAHSPKNYEVRSPVVSISRLSIDDISKWLPSRRNSSTDSSHSAKLNWSQSSKENVQLINDDSNLKHKRMAKISDNVFTVKGKSSDEITEITQKVVTKRKKKNKSMVNDANVQDSINNPTSGRNTNINKKITRLRKQNILEHISESDGSSFEEEPFVQILTRSKQNSRSEKICKKNKFSSNISDKNIIIEDNNNNEFDRTVYNRSKKAPKYEKGNKKSQIASVDLESQSEATSEKNIKAKEHCKRTNADPIGEIGVNQYFTRKLRSQNHVYPESQDGQDSTVDLVDNLLCSRRLRSRKQSLSESHEEIPEHLHISERNDSSSQLRERTRISPINFSLLLSSNDINESKELTTNKPKIRKPTKQCKFNIDNLTPDSKISTSTRKDINIGSKRKCGSPAKCYDKRRKLDDTAVLSESGPSLSSVNDWLRRSAPVTQVSANESCNEIIRNVMEKLDTTLMEIHHNTSKKFIEMFVSAQQRLLAVKQQRQLLYKSCAREMLKEMVQVIDTKFNDLEERCEEQDAEIMQELKAQGIKLIREDRSMKQGLVTLLREDIQSALGQVESQNF